MVTSSIQQHTPSLQPIHVRTDNWQPVIDLLKTEQYEEVIELLQEQHKTAVSDNNSQQTIFMEIATQICQACIQHQAEIEAHQQTQAQARQREEALNQRLIKMFELMPREIQPLSIDSPAESPLQKRSSLWQRVQSLIGNAEEEPTTNPTAKQHLPTLHSNGNTAVTHSAPQKPRLTIYCLGSFRVYLNGRVIENWTGNKSKSIFKHMALHNHHPANHEILIDLFWHGEDPEAARRNLYQAIYVIRQALQGGGDEEDFPYIICQDSAYRFNPQLTIWVDSIIFEEHYQKGLHLQRAGTIQEAIKEYELADSLYEGDFLREDIYEEWTLVHRERLKHTHLDLLDRLSQYYWTEEQYPQSITCGLKILQGDSCREDVHRRLMLAYLNQGQRHLAIKQYYRCVELLAEELGVEPMAETQNLYHHILNLN